MAKHPKRPRDLAQMAAQIGRQALGLDPKPPPTPPESAKARAGRKGGRKGGKARAKALSPKRRAEIARKAAKARWSA